MSSTSRPSSAIIHGIVLAAGRSVRMGRQKLLLPFAGQTVIGHIVDQVLDVPMRSTIVVVARDDHAVRGALIERKVTLVENPDPEGDMLSSIRAGLRVLEADATAALIVLGDQPSVGSELIRRILAAGHSSGRGIIAPVYGGKRGHPLLIVARYFNEILTSHDDAGLRGLLTAHGDDVFDLPVTDEGVLVDIDYPEDYERELSRFDKMQ